MNHDRRNLLTIGMFASAVQLSLKALRLYDQLDILKPAFIDSESGYRYYHLDQLHTARLIRMMRLMDMPLATIRQVLVAPPDEAEKLVLDYWTDMQRRMERTRHMVQGLVGVLRGEPTTMPIEVQVKTVEAQPILSITRKVTVDQLDTTIRTSLERLQALAQASNVPAVGAPFGIYHGVIDHESDGPIEVCLPVQRLIEPTDDANSRQLPGGKVAAVALAGAACDFPDILKGYDALVDWMRQNGYEQAESPREIWHTPPGADARMDIEWPFREPRT